MVSHAGADYKVAAELPGCRFMLLQEPEGVDQSSVSGAGDVSTGGCCEGRWAASLDE
jgi:hypothetical protein